MMPSLIRQHGDVVTHLGACSTANFTVVLCVVDAATQICVGITTMFEVSLYARSITIIIEKCIGLRVMRTVDSKRGPHELADVTDKLEYKSTKRVQL